MRFVTDDSVFTGARLAPSRERPDGPSRVMGRPLKLMDDQIQGERKKTCFL